MRFWTVDGGGVSAGTGGNLELTGNIGQVGAGRMTAMRYDHIGGGRAGEYSGWQIFLPLIRKQS